MSKTLVEITTSQIDVFIDIFSMLETISSDEVNISLKKESNENGNSIVIKTLSNSQTTVTITKISSEIFSVFNLKDQETTFWIDIKELNKFLKSIDSQNYTMSLIIEKNDPQILKISVNHNDKKNKYKTYEQVMIECNTIINFSKRDDFDFAIAISSQLFRKICVDMKKFSESIEIVCSDDKIIFRCLTKNNKYCVDCYENNDGDIIIKKLNNNINETKVSFYLEHLLKLKYSTNICNNIVLHIKNNFPLFIYNDILSNDKTKCGRMIACFSPFDNNLDHTKLKDSYKNVVNKLITE